MARGRRGTQVHLSTKEREIVYDALGFYALYADWTGEPDTQSVMQAIQRVRARLNSEELAEFGIGGG